jgi:hypothetical protein
LLSPLWNRARSDADDINKHFMLSSGFGLSEAKRSTESMSAFGGKADMTFCTAHVRF